MIKSLDHFVLTTRDENKCIDFYTRVMGMRLERFGNNRIALRFGDSKINVHPPSMGAVIKARYPVPGSLDLCFLVDGKLDDFIARLGEQGVAIEEGPGMRSGARFPIRSVYFRDPDDNLIEVSEPAEGQ